MSFENKCTTVSFKNKGSMPEFFTTTYKTFVLSTDQVGRKSKKAKKKLNYENNEQKKV